MYIRASVLMPGVVSDGFRTAAVRARQGRWFMQIRRAKWLPTKEVLMLSYYVFEIDYGYCGNYSVAIWASEVRSAVLLPLPFNRRFVYSE